MGATAGSKGNLIKICHIDSKRLQTDTISPVYSAVALSLDNCLLSGPGNDMRSKVIGGDELFFLVVEEFIAHPQHLLSIHLLSIHPDDLMLIDGNSHQMGRVGNADVDVKVFNKWRTLLIVAQRHRPPESTAQ